MDTIRVTCDCSLCETNATALGKTFPLAADVNLKMAEHVGLTAANANKPKKVHGLVYTAHDPSLIGSAMVAKFGPWAA